MDCTAEDEAEGAGGGEEAGAEAGAPEVRAGAHRLTTDAVWSCDGPPAACSRPARGLPAAYPRPALGLPAAYPRPSAYPWPNSILRTACVRAPRCC